MLAMAKSMLNLDSSPVATAVSDTATAAKLPLRESLSSVNNGRNSRSSAGSSTGKALLQQTPATPGASKLSGQEQDAVVAKIRSAAKRSASPEKKLPYQDDDTPNTKGARLKKEMEVQTVSAAESTVCRGHDVVTGSGDSTRQCWQLVVLLHRQTRHLYLCTCIIAII